MSSFNEGARIDVHTDTIPIVDRNSYKDEYDFQEGRLHLQPFAAPGRVYGRISPSMELPASHPLVSKIIATLPQDLFNDFTVSAFPTSDTEQNVVLSVRPSSSEQFLSYLGKTLPGLISEGTLSEAEAKKIWSVFTRTAQRLAATYEDSPALEEKIKTTLDLLWEEIRQDLENHVDFAADEKRHIEIHEQIHLWSWNAFHQQYMNMNDISIFCSQLDTRFGFENFAADSDLLRRVYRLQHLEHFFTAAQEIIAIVHEIFGQLALVSDENYSHFLYVSRMTQIMEMFATSDRRNLEPNIDLVIHGEAAGADIITAGTFQEHVTAAIILLFPETFNSQQVIKDLTLLSLDPDQSLARLKAAILKRIEASTSDPAFAKELLEKGYDNGVVFLQQISAACEQEFLSLLEKYPWKVKLALPKEDRQRLKPYLDQIESNAGWLTKIRSLLKSE